MTEINRLTLDNGLRLVHHYNPSVPTVAMNVVYNVGARDEDPGMTGLAHLFEHLMFGGSVNIPDFDAATEAAGGTNNAWTSNDFTSFYDVFPAVNAETAFWLESDRMLGIALTPETIETQRHVVIEEFKETCLDQPYGDMMHHLRGLLYTTHPYGWPTIGKSIEQLERMTHDDIARFFLTHYAPNNAVVSVGGDITFERAAELARKWFGQIERRDIAPRLYKPEPLPTAPRRKVVTARVPQTMLTIAFPMGGIDSPDYVPADLLTDILASGNSSRFYRRLLLGTDIFNEIDASIIGSNEPGALMVSAKLARNSLAEADRAIEAITAQLNEIAAEGPDATETRRAINRFESNRTFSNINNLNLTMNIAQDEIQGVDFNSVNDTYRRVTPDDIRSCARRIFRPEHASTLIYGPEELTKENQ